MDIFETGIKEKKQLKDLKKQEQLKKEDKDQTSPPHDNSNKQLTET